MSLTYPSSAIGVRNFRRAIDYFNRHIPLAADDRDVPGRLHSENSASFWTDDNYPITINYSFRTLPS